jgi:8-oxo-dGTP pyrophosphatase MutT (NUDIX family)
MNEELTQWLARRLAQPLPGPMLESRFEGRPHRGQPDSSARAAAVLLLLYPHQGQWHLPFTLRPSHLAAHAGQVSLPGGAVEPGESTAEAALREFHEELGEDGTPIDLLGALSPLFVRVSNFLVVPWVAAAERRPRFVPDPAEVEELLEVPLAHLLDPAQFGSHPREHEGETYPAPHFLFRSHRIWGATCMILGEFVTILEECPCAP